MVRLDPEKYLSQPQETRMDLRMNSKTGMSAAEWLKAISCQCNTGAANNLTDESLGRLSLLVAALAQKCLNEIALKCVTDENF